MKTPIQTSNQATGHCFLPQVSGIAVIVMLVAAPSLAETTTFRLTFQSTWNSENHPDSFPPGPHFSGLIGSTHDANVSLWSVGDVATRGIESMAETGSKTALIQEIEAAQADGTADTLISGSGIGVLNGQASIEFDANSLFPLVSVVSMIAPSPDWFVGIADFDLRPEGQWISKVEIPLGPYDAGTDSGTSYESDNKNTSPVELISPIDGAPFTGTGPLGTFTILQRIDGDVSENGVLDADDIDRLSEAVRSSNEDEIFDLDGSGTVDGQDRKFWVEQIVGTTWGDATLDGFFDSTDLVAVLASGHYEDGIDGNATWATGDWDGDGDTTSGDLTLGLQTGAYEAESNLAASAVPEPSGMSRLVIALLALAVNRGRRGADQIT